MTSLCNLRLEHVFVQQKDILPHSRYPRCTFTEYRERQDRQEFTIDIGQSNRGYYVNIMAMSLDGIVRSLLT